jgi:hypothetical protein
MPDPSAPNNELPPTPRDAQRRALEELIRLASECVSIDANLRKTLDAAREKAERELRTQSTLLAADLDGKIDDRSREIESARTQLIDQQSMEVAKIVEKFNTLRQRVLGEYESQAGKIKKEYQDAQWLAESVVDSAILAAKQSYKQTVEKTEADRTGLDELRSDGVKRLQRLGMQELGLTPVPELNQENTDEPTPADRFESARETARLTLDRLDQLRWPKLLVGAMPLVLGVVIVAAAAAVTQPWSKNLGTEWQPTAIASGIGLMLAVGIGIGLNILASRRITSLWNASDRAIAEARAALDQRLLNAAAKRDVDIESAKASRDAESARIKQHFTPLADRAKAKRDEQLRQVDLQFESERDRLEKAHQLARSKFESESESSLSALRDERRSRLGCAQDIFDQHIASATAAFENAQTDLVRRWESGLDATQSQSRLTSGPGLTRFGTLRIDLSRIASDAGSDLATTRLVPPPSYDVPAWLAMPRQASLLIEHDRAARDTALDMLRATVYSLLTTIEPGRCRFTFIDPVGLGQSFAGFMHLADDDDALITGRIWSEQQQIDQRLVDLTEHMETVIQKYLRNEFQTIDEYNAQAGELAEPYRFLVIADLPAGFSDESLRRLANIATSGARCGVYVIVSRDARSPIAQSAVLDDLRLGCSVLNADANGIVWRDPVFGRFAFTPAPAPDDATLTAALRDVGRRAKANKRIEVPFASIAPQESQRWSLDASSDVGVPVGRSGATRLQFFRLGRGVAQHCLIAGKTGSGKSTLLNVLITNLALWYSPDEVEMYLIDFKRGVEFKAYAAERLPHARAIAVESDREFGLSVLQRLDAELNRRGELYRRAGAQDLASYRNERSRDTTLPVLPRQLLIVDEFQELFSEDDKLSQEASTLIDRLVRQGRAFGIHVVLGSQTIGGQQGVPRATFGQMAVRVALQCTEADSQLILGDNNSAARLLSRPGEAIYNDAGGAVENNSPFQISWLSDETRVQQLRAARELAESRGYRNPGCSVFEGNAPAHLQENLLVRDTIAGLTKADATSVRPAALRFMLGEAVAIKPATAIALRSRAGANALVIGQQDEQAASVLASGILGLSLQLPPRGFKVTLLDATPADSALAGRLSDVLHKLGVDVVDVPYRDAPDAVVALASTIASRRDEANPQPHILLINGLHRYRDLRKQEESFSFSMDDDKPKSTPPDKALAELLRDGPSAGIHVIAWIDTVAALERTIDRSLIREFDHRVLFQMSANDSATLIDSTAGNKLGTHRALYYSEELGVIEKFRPYALPSADLLEKLRGSR